MSDDPGRVTDSAFFSRIVNSVVFTGLTAGFLLAAIVRQVHVYGNLIASDDAGLYVRSTAKVIYGREKLRKKEKPACSLKVGFSVLVIAVVTQVALGITDGLTIFAMVSTKAPCRYRCHTLTIVAHFCSLLGIAMGTLIHGDKDRDKLGWGFWMAVTAGVLCLLNCGLLLQTNQMRLSFMKSGVGLGVLYRGGKIEA